MTAREAWLASMDVGIAPYVDVLDAAGIETYESCEGGNGHSYAEPAVRFYGVRGEGFRALAVAVQNGLPVRAIRRLWTVDEAGEPHGPYWEIAFWWSASDADARMRPRVARAPAVRAARAGTRAAQPSRRARGRG